MAAGLFPIWRYACVNNGVPVPGARLYSWLSGTSTPHPVYADEALNVARTNPVIADAAGVFPVMFMGQVAYRMEVRDANDVTIYPAQDGVTNFGSFLLPPNASGVLENDGAGALSWTQAPALTIPTVTTRIDLTGGQIQFPPSPIPSSDPNTLDDYEEGTWTPLWGGSGGQSGQGYGDRRGWYLKIGQTVWVAGEMHLTTKGTITGDLQIQGLPFVSEAVGTGQSACAFADFDGTATDLSWIAGFIVSNSTHVLVRYKDMDASGSMGSADASLINDGVACGFSATYRADS